MDKQKVVAVVMGGPSDEREISLITGKAIANALREKGYKIVEIDLEPKMFFEQMRENKVDIVFNAVHGLYGEDGRLQTLLEILEIPYTGTGMLASAICLDKAASKRILQFEKISTPKALIFNKDDHRRYDKEILEKFKALPVVVKPALQGSSIGVEIITDSEKINQSIENAFKYSKEVIVEEFIDGKELTVSIMENDGELEALPIIEIRPHSGVYDFHSKYTKGATEYIVPAQISEADTKNIQQTAIDAYKLLGCSGVARVDIMLNKENSPYVLEINTVPGMTETSLVPKAAASVGITFPDLCEKILLSASCYNK